MHWIQQLAPSGTLRVCINLGNALLAQWDETKLKAQGISVELAQALADTYKIGLQLQMVQTAKEAVAAVANKTADIGFFAIDPARATEIAFTKAYLHIDACYAVRKDAGIENTNEVDQEGRYIVVGLGSAYDLFLSRHIQKAHLVRAASTQEVVPVFLSQGHDVAAGLQHALSQVVKEHRELKLLDPPFMAIAQAMGCHPSQSDAVKAGLLEFLNERQQAIRESIAHHQLSGVRVA